MIDEKLYRETFSRLRASDEAKKEVLLNMSETKKMRRPLKLLRAAALAAMLTVALAVTANAASNGALVENLRIIWQDDSHIVMEDDNGNLVSVVGEVGVFADAELQDGRLVLTVDDAKFDITEDIVNNGAYSATVKSADGSEVEVNVAGTLEDWEVSTSTGDGETNYNVITESGASITKSAATITTD